MEELHEDFEKVISEIKEYFTAKTTKVTEI